MKIKAFRIRTNENDLEADQQLLNDFSQNIIVKKVACELIQGPPDYWSVLLFYQEQAFISNTTGKIGYSKDTVLTDHEMKIFEAFKEWRLNQSVELGIPVYMVCSNAELIALVKERPETKDDLLKIKGFGEYKISKYGVDIFAILNSF